MKVKVNLSGAVLYRLALPPFRKSAEYIKEIQSLIALDDENEAQRQQVFAKLLQLLNEVFLYLVPGYRIESRINNLQSSRRQDDVETNQKAATIDQVISRMLDFVQMMLTSAEADHNKDVLDFSTIKMGFENGSVPDLISVLEWILVESGLMDGQTLYEVDATLLRQSIQGQGAYDPVSSAVLITPEDFNKSRFKSFEVVNIGSTTSTLEVKKSNDGIQFDKNDEETDILSMMSSKRRLRHQLKRKPTLSVNASNILHVLLERYLPRDLLKFEFGGSLNSLLRFRSRNIDKSLPNMATAKAFSWHCSKEYMGLGVVHKDDCLNIYDCEKENWIKVGVMHELQRDVTCMAFKPLCGVYIALGCKNGVCLWEKNCTSIKFIKYEAGYIVDALTWSPDGALLAIGSSQCSTVIIWEAATNRATIWPCVMSGTSQLEWSPNGSYLYSASKTGHTFCVWETMTWSVEHWSDFKGVIHAASWSPDGKTLAVVAGDMDNENKGPGITLYCLAFSKTPPKILGVITPVTVDLGQQAAQYSSCGTAKRSIRGVREICWDTSGKRIAICYDGAPAVAVYAVKFSPFLHFSYHGSVWGPPATLPYAVRFKPKYGKGALLMVAYCHPDEPRTSLVLVPMYFT